MKLILFRLFREFSNYTDRRVQTIFWNIETSNFKLRQAASIKFLLIIYNYIA